MYINNYFTQNYFTLERTPIILLTETGHFSGTMTINAMSKKG